MKEIIPYAGFEDITFKMSYDQVRKFLRPNGIKYNTENWPNKGCTPEVAWDIIRIGRDVSLFFAKGRMFKIYFENGYAGSLTNGISIGMTMEVAQEIDPSIHSLR